MNEELEGWLGPRPPENAPAFKSYEASLKKQQDERFNRNATIAAFAGIAALFAYSHFAGKDASAKDEMSQLAAKSREAQQVYEAAQKATAEKGLAESPDDEALNALHEKIARFAGENGVAAKDAASIVLQMESLNGYSDFIKQYPEEVAGSEKSFDDYRISLIKQAKAEQGK